MEIEYSERFGEWREALMLEERDGRTVVAK
jgi:hypothetical protein